MGLIKKKLIPVLYICGKQWYTYMYSKYPFTLQTVYEWIPRHLEITRFCWIQDLPVGNPTEDYKFLKVSRCYNFKQLLTAVWRMLLSQWKKVHHHYPPAQYFFPFIFFKLTFFHQFLSPSIQEFPFLILLCKS